MLEASWMEQDCMISRSSVIITLYGYMTIIQFVQWNENVYHKSIREILQNNMTNIYSGQFHFHKNKKRLNKEILEAMTPFVFINVSERCLLHH